MSPQPPLAVTAISADKVTKASLTLETARSTASTKPINKTWTKSARTSTQEHISPEVVPSDWDSSLEEDLKAEKPKSVISAAPKLK
ncbi:hypothetical protein PGT21_011991 [Puccinia graminis f. sp. tritici]|uniref:Uncharacterized protein n=1 Tax=Puccinia graminis f. sp. tritici TaxID=56615 RepID=A0A5B0S4U5_PUCGR|nr:hypothetical protein PGT21_011991 [Puccinia graminis f. sp. tritici]KAA1132133.1 hypothetical protein PGTUg99_037355 [Puccinia graminis f. sp. tritici]